MPIVVSNEGWVKIPPKKGKPKPVDPMGALRGPLAYITGRPDLKEPVKKQQIKQLLIEAPPLHPPIIESRDPRSYRSKKDRSASGPAPSKSRHRRLADEFGEVDEEIIRPELQPEDSQSRRSASPAASRNARTAPPVRSRRDPPRPASVYDDGLEIDGDRHSRSRRHASQSAAYYDEPRSHHRSDRTHRNSYHRERDHDRYYPSHANYSTPQLPTLQPIVIYSTPPAAMGGGCGGYHSCHGHGSVYQTQCYAAPQPLPMAAPRAALEAPRPAPSEISSRSSSSSKSKPMSYKWYTATQPLNI